MDGPDLSALRAKLIEAQEELQISSDLAEQVDLHAAAAKAKIVEARQEFDRLAGDIGKAMAATSGKKGQQS